MKWLAIFFTLLVPSFCIAADFFTHKPPSSDIASYKPSISSFDGHVHPPHTFFTHKSSKGGKKGSVGSTITTSSGTTLNINVNTSPSDEEREWRTTGKESALEHYIFNADKEDFDYYRPTTHKGYKGKEHKQKKRDQNNRTQFTNQPTGLIDSSTGKFYPPVAGGVIDPENGTFYQKVGGGYINTRTGRFVPAQ